MNTRYYALYESYFKGFKFLHPESNRWAIRYNSLVIITLDLKDGELVFDILLT